MTGTTPDPGMMGTSPEPDPGMTCTSDGKRGTTKRDGLGAELDSYFGKEGATEAKDDPKEDAKAVEYPLNP